MGFVIFSENKIMKNFRKYIPITFTTLAVAFLMFGMTYPHGKEYYREYEHPVFVEEWMTKPFTDSIDEPLEVEDWMTRPFNIN